VMVVRWCLDSASPVCCWCCVWLVFYDTNWFSDCFQICWDLHNSFLVFDVFQIYWDLQVSLSLVYLYRIIVDCLKAACELRLICLCFHSTVVPSAFDSMNCFLDSDGPITFDSRSEVSVLLHLYGSVNVFSSGLKAAECILKNEIKSGSLFGGVWFGIFIGFPLIYTAPLIYL
jgi:hypothetical protein